MCLVCPSLLGGSLKWSEATYSEQYLTNGKSLIQTPRISVRDDIERNTIFGEYMKNK